jgi:hypothetical protein
MKTIKVSELKLGQKVKHKGETGFVIIFDPNDKQCMFGFGSNDEHSNCFNGAVETIKNIIKWGSNYVCHSTIDQYKYYRWMTANEIVEVIEENNSDQNIAAYDLLNGGALL